MVLLFRAVMKFCSTNRLFTMIIGNFTKSCASDYSARIHTCQCPILIFHALCRQIHYFSYFCKLSTDMRSKTIGKELTKTIEIMLWIAAKLTFDLRYIFSGITFTSAEKKESVFGSECL